MVIVIVYNNNNTSVNKKKHIKKENHKYINTYNVVYNDNELYVIVGIYHTAGCSCRLNMLSTICKCIYTYITGTDPLIHSPSHIIVGCRWYV